MEKRSFTAARVEGFSCESGKQQTIYWDAKTPRSRLSAAASGAKVYVFESRLFGKTIRLTIGDARA